LDVNREAVRIAMDLDGRFTFFEPDNKRIVCRILDFYITIVVYHESKFSPNVSEKRF
jgi:hypothetical protein